MFVYIMLQFFPYDFQTIQNDSLFLPGYVQRFVDFIREKGVVLYRFIQWRAAKQVGMEDDAIGIGLYMPDCRRRLCCLSGSETDDGPFFVIVFLAAVLDVACLFQF